MFTDLFAVVLFILYVTAVGGTLLFAVNVAIRWWRCRGGYYARRAEMRVRLRHKGVKA